MYFALSMILISTSTISQRAAATPPQRVASGKAPARVAVPLYTTAKTPIGTLLDDPAARVIVDRHIPNTSTDRRIYFARKFTLKGIQPMSQGKITDRQLAAIDAELARLRKR